MSFLPIFDAIAPVVNKILNFIPDPQQKLEAQQQLMAALMTWDTQQSEVNKVEASNSSLFVSGWRPFIGWVCGLALAYQYMIVPLVTWVCAFFLVNIPGFPSLDDNLWQLLFGMLGMGGLRTFEKIKGVAR